MFQITYKRLYLFSIIMYEIELKVFIKTSKMANIVHYSIFTVFQYFSISVNNHFFKIIISNVCLQLNSFSNFWILYPFFCYFRLNKSQ